MSFTDDKKFPSFSFETLLFCSSVLLLIKIYESSSHFILSFLFLQIGSLKNYFLFHHPHVHRRSLTFNETHHENLKKEPEVNSQRNNLMNQIMTRYLFLLLKMTIRVRMKEAKILTTLDVTKEIKQFFCSSHFIPNYDDMH
jgi:hypothetical protein